MDREKAEAIIKGYLEEYLEGQGIDTRKPFCCLNPDHADSNPSMSYDRKRNKCHCFSCGADYSILDLIGIDYNLTDTGEIYRKAYSLYDIDIDKGSTKNMSKTNKTTHTHNDIHTYTYTQEEEAKPDNMAYYKECMEALANSGYSYSSFRGISKATAQKYMLGLDKNFNKGTGGAVWEALIIPTSKTTYTARNTDTNADKANRVRKAGGSILYNSRVLAEAQKPIFIVEGEIDTLSIIDVGGVALGLGSTANANQLIKRVREQKPVQPLIIALDNDEEGQKKAEELTTELNKLGVPSYRLDIYGEYKDANEALTSNREAFASYVADAEREILSLIEKASQQEKEEYLKNSTASYIQDFINGIAESVNTKATPTGFDNLDNILDGGLYEGLYTCGAISSLGKTTFALQIVDQIAQAGNDVIIFSLEMARAELMSKSISRLTLTDIIKNNGLVSNAKTARGITCGDRYSKYSTEEKNLIKRAIKEYSTYAGHIFIHEGIGDVGVNEIRQTIEKHIRLTGNRPVILVDYMQILAPADVRATDKQNTDKAVLELKRISRDYKIPVIAISSVNRASYKDKITMEAMKESGSIEFSSDVILGLQLKGVGGKSFDVNEAKAKNPREIELVILKNRNGATGGTVSFEYYPIFNYFKEEGI